MADSDSEREQSRWERWTDKSAVWFEGLREWFWRHPKAYALVTFLAIIFFFYILLVGLSICQSYCAPFP